MNHKVFDFARKWLMNNFNDTIEKGIIRKSYNAPKKYFCCLLFSHSKSYFLFLRKENILKRIFLFKPSFQVLKYKQNINKINLEEEAEIFNSFITSVSNTSGEKL